MNTGNGDDMNLYGRTLENECLFISLIHHVAPLPMPVDGSLFYKKHKKMKMSCWSKAKVSIKVQKPHYCTQEEPGNNKDT